MLATFRFAAVGLLGLAVSACAVESARIAIPSDVAASADRLELTGMGGFGKGHFQFAGARGTFSRNADRLGILDPLLIGYSGESRFDLAASSAAPAMSGRCTYGERKVSVGVVSVSPHAFSYTCQLSTMGIPTGRLMLHSPHGMLGSASGRSEREGMFEYKDQRLIMRSIHRLAGTPLPVQAPLGYMFIADGRQVGAVDLNGPNKTILAPRSPELREAVIAASLALSILWDPADVQPDY